MLEFLPYLIPLSVSILIGLVSLLLYLEIKKAGFVLIGIGFLTNMIPSLINLALGGPYLPLRLLGRGFTTTQIGQFIFVLGMIGMALEIVFAILVLVGMVFLSRDFETRQ